MSAAAADRRRESLAPALLAALGLHVSVFLLASILGRPHFVPGGGAVPITIVAHGPPSASRTAEPAERVQAARSETPAPAAEPAPPPPPKPPAPRTPPVRNAEPPPAPPKPRPEPRPPIEKARPKPPPPTPQPPIERRRTPAPTTAPPSPADTFSLDKLAAELNRGRHPSPPHPPGGLRGSPQNETGPPRQSDKGPAVSEGDVAGLQQLLNRLWNKSCNLDDTVVVQVTFAVGEDGRVVGRVSAGGRENAANPAVAVAARRAIDAVNRAEPYGAVYRGQTFKVNFDAKKACAAG